MKKEKQYIIDWMYQLDFENAAKHLFQLPEEEQISLMVCEAADTDSIVILGFLSYILSIQKTAFYHQVFSEVLVQMCWLAVVTSHRKGMLLPIPKIDRKEQQKCLYSLV